jgi:hypothetical protein
VKPVLVNRTTNRILDGHLRVEEAARAGSTVPVLYLELNEREENLVLATLDPIAELAVPDKEQLQALLADLEGAFESARPLLEQIAAEAKLGTSAPPAGDDEPTVTCPRCGTTFDRE